MQSIKEALAKRVVVKRPPNSPRAEQVQSICDLMGDKRFKYWLGRTRSLSPDAIFHLLKEARTGKNPPALFNWFLKQELK